MAYPKYHKEDHARYRLELLNLPPIHPDQVKILFLQEGWPQMKRLLFRKLECEMARATLLDVTEDADIVKGRARALDQLIKHLEDDLMKEVRERFGPE